MSTNTESLSASYAGLRFGVTEKTARLFMHKVREAMENSGNNPMDEIVHVDEFVLAGREKDKIGRRDNTKKAIMAIELTGDGKVRRIKDVSARPL